MAVRGGSAVLALALAFCPTASDADDVSSVARWSIAPPVHDIATGAEDTRVTVRNTGADSITGPLRLVLTGGRPADLGLAYANGRTDDGFDYVEVPLTDGLLAPGASASVGVSLVPEPRSALRPDFRVEGIVLTPTTSRRLTIVVDPSPIEGFPSPGSGFTVFVDGYRRGTTDSTGRASLPIPVATTQVDVYLAPTWKGFGNLLPEPRDTNPVTVHASLDEGAELFAEADLRIDEVSQRILRRGAARITLRLSRRGVPVRLEPSNVRVHLEGLSGIVELTSLFRIEPDGSLSASATRFHEVAGSRREPLTLTVSGRSVDDRPDNDFMVDTTFVVACEAVTVRLRPPPSNPVLATDGVLVVAHLLGTGVRVAAVSDPEGRATFRDLPSGNVAFRAERTAGGMVYRGDGTVALDHDSIVDLTMRGLADVLANVMPVSRRSAPVPPPAR